MRGKSVFATIVTLTLMCGFVFVTAAGIIIAAATPDPLVAGLLGIGVTVAFSALNWYFGPPLLDYIQRWLYEARPMPIEELGRHRPAVAGFIQHVCQKHRIPLPAIRYIDDMAPQAYCYGRTRGSARLVVTRGLLHYLNDEKLKSVCAHELGHIVHNDFVVMTMASTMLQILFCLYVIARRQKGGDRGNVAVPVAIAAYVFHLVAQYLLLYLSRVREYYADEFAGVETGNPNALSMALVKIAYGLTRLEPGGKAQQLLAGTRALGISDGRTSANLGNAYVTLSRQAQPPMQPAYAGAYGAQAAAMHPAYAGAHGAQPAAQSRGAEVSVTYEGVRRIEKAMLFDIYNPWARVLELTSTHPLTGRRILALGQQGMRWNQRPLCTFEALDAAGRPLDRARLAGGFLFDATVYFLPVLLGGLAMFAAAGSLAIGNAALSVVLSCMIFVAIGVGGIIQSLFSFPRLGTPRPTSVLELMMDPYASPLRGQPVCVDGTIVGRSDAGNKVDEDFIIEDRSGGLMAINYESGLSTFGNMLFATERLDKLMRTPVRVVGWFRRSLTQQIDLKTMYFASGSPVASWTAFWSRAWGFFLIAFGLFLAFCVVSLGGSAHVTIEVF